MPKIKSAFIGLTVILSLCLATVGNASKAPAAKFTSAYTDLNKDCKDAFKEVGEGQDMPLRCKGYGGYYLYIYYSAWASHINAQMRGNDDVTISLAMQELGYSDAKGRKVEWRMADGKPFAVILRVSHYKESTDGNSPFDEKLKTGESLVVKGLKGYEHIDGSVDAKTPDANVKARQLADSQYK
ncbi:MAG TPA: hypothetical protein VF543_06370 [Pyrinomonadaceae bacterium]